MADITQELIVIASEPKGRLVKDAIHDALLKVNEDSEAKGDAPENAVMIVNAVPIVTIPEIIETEG
jgi:hypothetical protein